MPSPMAPLQPIDEILHIGPRDRVHRYASETRENPQLNVE